MGAIPEAPGTPGQMSMRESVARCPVEPDHLRHGLHAMRCPRRWRWLTSVVYEHDQQIRTPQRVGPCGCLPRWCRTERRSRMENRDFLPLANHPHRFTSCPSSWMSGGRASSPNVLMTNRRGTTNAAALVRSRQALIFTMWGTGSCLIPPRIGMPPSRR